MRPDDPAAYASGALREGVDTLEPEAVDEGFMHATNASDEDNRNVERRGVTGVPTQIRVGGAEHYSSARLDIVESLPIASAPRDIRWPQSTTVSQPYGLGTSRLMYILQVWLFRRHDAAPR